MYSVQCCVHAVYSMFIILRVLYCIAAITIIARVRETVGLPHRETELCDRHPCHVRSVLVSYACAVAGYSCCSPFMSHTVGLPSSLTPCFASVSLCTHRVRGPLLQLRAL